MSRKQITPGGFIAMLALTMEATPISIGIAPVIQSAHEDAWMVPPLATVAVLVVLFPLYRLFARLGIAVFDDEQPLSIWAKLLLIPLCLVLFYWIVFNAHVFCDLLHLGYLTETPTWVIYCGFLTVAVFASFHGIEVLGRVAILISSVKAIALFITPIFVLEDVDFHHLLPLLAHGPRPVLDAMWEPFAWFSEGAVLAFLFPLVKKARYRHVLYSFLVMLESYYMLFVGSILVFSAPLAARMLYPALMLIQLMAIGDFFDRVDPLMVAVWTFAMFVKASVYLLILSALLSRLFRVQLRTRLSWGLAVLAVFFADGIVDSVGHEVQIYREYWPMLSLFVLLDLYLLVWVLLHRHEGKDKNESWNATEGRTTDGSACDAAEH